MGFSVMCDVIEKFSMMHDCMIATLQRQLNLGLNAYCIFEMHNKFVVHNWNHLGEYFKESSDKYFIYCWYLVHIRYINGY